MREDLLDKLQDLPPPHLIRVKQRIQIGQLENDLNNEGIKLFHIINAHLISNKTELLTQFAETCDLPSYFGENWDALTDCLSDFSWFSASGYVFVFNDFVSLRRTEPKSYNEIYSILTDVGERWAKEKILFKGLVFEQN